MLNAKSNPGTTSVRTASRELMMYADGVVISVPSNAQSETVSTTLLKRAVGSPRELSPQAATATSAATNNAMSGRGGRMAVRRRYRAAFKWVNPRSMLDFHLPRLYVGAPMATIRDVVEALSRRSGVEAGVVVGRDGLPIAAPAANGVGPAGVGPLLPSVMYAMSPLGAGPARGRFGAPALAIGRAAMAGSLPDALLLDLPLPDGSGVDLLRDLRRQAGGAALPVVVLTAEGEDRVLAELGRLGAAVLSKPFSPSKLTAQLAEMLGDPGSAESAESAT